MPVRIKCLPWNAPQEFALLKLIKFHKAHIAPRGETVALWNRVNDDLYKQDPFAEYVVDCYKQGDIRKLREKFANLEKTYSQKNGWGSFFGGTNQNLSGLSGDLSIVATLLKELLSDIEKESAAEAIRNDLKEAQKRKLDEISKKAIDKEDFDIRKKKPAKMKSLDGTVFERTDKPPRKTSFEDVMMASVQKLMGGGEVSNDEIRV